MAFECSLWNSGTIGHPFSYLPPDLPNGGEWLLVILFLWVSVFVLVQFGASDAQKLSQGIALPGVVLYQDGSFICPVLLLVNV